MILTSRKTALAGLATLGVSALVLAGCAAAPTATTTSKAAIKFLPCMVSDSGGFDDHSFNELGKDGLDSAAKALGVKSIAVESKSDSDYAPNIDSLLSQGCDLIITVGFNLSAASLAAAKANPDTKFAIIDDAADADFDGKVDDPNIKPILFDTAQSAFLAGYAAASYSKAGKVATWGGMNFPTVTIFMDGFAQGVAYYNKEKSKNVEVLGYDPANPGAATFTGGFEANDAAKTVAKNFIDQGADVLLPVGGPIYQSAVAAIQDSGKDDVLVGVDADLFVTDPTTDAIVLTSVEKGIESATKNVIEDAAGGDFNNTAYIGTLKNDGVGIAPFHNFDSKVDSGLKGELDKIKASIISGDLKVTSYLNK